MKFMSCHIFGVSLKVWPGQRIFSLVMCVRWVITELSSFHWLEEGSDSLVLDTWFVMYGGSGWICWRLKKDGTRLFLSLRLLLHGCDHPLHSLSLFLFLICFFLLPQLKMSRILQLGSFKHKSSIFSPGFWSLKYNVRLC